MKLSTIRISQFLLFLLSLCLALLLARASFGYAAYNRTTNTTYATLKLALQALNNQTATQNILIEYDGSQPCAGASVNGLNMGSYTLTIRPVGYVEGAKSNPVFYLDGGGTDNILTFNNTANVAMGNIRLYGIYFDNTNYNSGSCKALSGLGIKGNNLVKDCSFTNGAVPIRWVGAGSSPNYIPCENLTIEDCFLSHGFGAFRFGLGLATTYRDLGVIAIRRCRTRWDRRYQTGALTDPGNATTGHVVAAIKNAQELIFEDCQFDGAGKDLLALENTEAITVRRCKLLNAGIMSTNGGAINYKANSGYRPTVWVTSCLFTGNLTSIVFGDGTGSSLGEGALLMRQNTIVEAPTANKNIIYLANGLRFDANYNNIYSLNSSATAVVVNFGSNVSGTASQWRSDYNTWYKTNGSRSLVGGSIGGTSVAATNLSNLKTQAMSGDPNASTRDLHSDGTKPVFNYEN